MGILMKNIIYLTLFLIALAGCNQSFIQNRYESDRTSCQDGAEQWSSTNTVYNDCMKLYNWNVAPPPKPAGGAKSE